MNNANAKQHKELSLSECVHVLVSLVLKNMLTLHLASPVTHRRIPRQSPNYNVFVAHRSNAMFIHISMSNVLWTASRHAQFKASISQRAL